MKKYLLIIIFILFGKIALTKDMGDILPLYTNVTLGYQTGYAYNLNQSYLHAIDFNVAFIVPNFSVNYQFKMGWKIFGGIGFSDVCQLQFGYSFGTNEFLIRIRSDWNLSTLYDFGLFYCHSTLKIPTIGFFFENRMNRHGYQGFNVGITVALPIPYLENLEWYSIR